MHQLLSINHEAYSRPISADDRTQYGMKSKKLAWLTGSITFGGLFLLLGPLFFFLGGMDWTLLAIAFAISLGIGLTLLIALLIPNNHEIRLRRFAHANGFSYSLSAGGQGMQGVLFEVGSSRATKHVFRLPADVVVANWEFEPVNRDSTVTWRFIELPLPRQVPHLVLDSVANDGLFGSNLPQGLRADQRIELEGDFNRIFTVYAPQGYDFDLRYLLPPDTMALLADNLQHFDIELLGDRMRIVEKGGWDHSDPRMWQFVEWVVGVLHPHMHRRTLRYQDAKGDVAPTPLPDDDSATEPVDRVEMFRERWSQAEPLSGSYRRPTGAGSVAPAGRKLRTTPWKTILSIIGGVVFVGFGIVIRILSE